jgi:endoglucanase
MRLFERFLTRRPWTRAATGRAVIGAALGSVVAFGVVTSAPALVHPPAKATVRAVPDPSRPAELNAPINAPSASTPAPATSEPAAATGPAGPSTATSKAAPKAVAKVPVTVSRSGNPFAGRTLYVAPLAVPGGLSAADTAAIARMFAQPQAIWIGSETSSGNVAGRVSGIVGAAAASGRLPLLVAYDIPGRDCGSYSAGGAGGSAAYLGWIGQFAAGIGTRPAAVVLEPDALAQVDCLSAAGQADRYALIAQAIALLKAHAGTAVYVDAGNSGWISAGVMAQRLKASGIAAANGFSLNVSNFHTTAQEEAYGNALSSLVGGKHFVIDTSRNGAGAAPGGAWCNPPGRALGALPGSAGHGARVDALLWIKRPGESDGTCNGGPSAGGFWPAYAAGLAHAIGW